MKTKYIIKGNWDNQEVYYIGIDKKHRLFGMPVVRLSTALSEAKKFNSMHDVEKEYAEVSHVTFKIYPVCPICNCDYDGYPAISRADNKSKICSSCGTKEALDIFNNYLKNKKAEE